MDTSYTNDANAHGLTVAATFPNADAAREAAKRLHDEGFHNIWHGETKLSDGDAAGNDLDNSYSADPSASRLTIADDGDSVWSKMGRFFSGEGDESLLRILTNHGLTVDQAQNVEQALTPNSSILTVSGSNHPEYAAQIVRECGGQMITGDTDDVTTAASATTFASTAAPTTTADWNDAPATDTILSSPAPSSRLYNASTTMDADPLDDNRRLQLREERLNINKERVSAGEAAVGKTVESSQQRIDVPTYREELFIERRPASGNATGTIGDGETIRIPLSEERVVVGKETVVAEEVVIGKRRVNETEHVDETVRREQLAVDGDRTPPAAPTSGTATYGDPTI